MKSFFRKVLRRPLRKLGFVPVSDTALPRFGNCPNNLTIVQPRTICYPEDIFFGDDVWLGPGSLLIPLREYPVPLMKKYKTDPDLQHFSPTIAIGNRVTATAALQLAAMTTISIGDDVMFASNINITDGLHGFENADEPYKFQKMFRIAPISIGNGCWIGQNVVILPGVHIGELSIIGANSVVTKSVPEKCIAVGSPAKVIKRWDEKKREWIRTGTLQDNDGGVAPEYAAGLSD